MSDINQAPEGDLPSGSAAGADNFEENWQSFLSHNFGEVDTAEAVVDPTKEETTPAPSGESTISGGAGQDTISGASGADTQASASGQDSAAAPASNNAPEGGEGQDTVDQTLVARMLGLGNEAKPTGGSSAAPGASGAPSGSSGQDGEESLFLPFTPDFKIDPKISAPLFEAEDTESREKALRELLSAFGNTIVQVVEMRQKEHYAPQVLNQFAEVSMMRQASQTINADFFGEFPELKDYGPAVKRAIAVIAETRGADKPWDPDARNAAGNLARTALIQSGIKLPPRKGSAAPQQQQQQQQQQTQRVAQTPFEAGGSRPAAGGPSGPGDLVEELSQWA